MESMKIPIVDLSPVIQSCSGRSNSTNWDTVSSEIDKALEEVGFVYFINHGIPNDKVEKAFLESKHFFELESNVKSKFKKNMSLGIKGYHGYSSPSTELVNQPECELRESFDVNPCDPSPKYPDIDAPKLQPALWDLEVEFRNLIMVLIKLIAKSLGLANDSLLVNCIQSVNEPLNNPSFNSLRCNYYPVISKDVQITPNTVRCREHTDWGLFTLLFQDSVGGLEVKSKDTWVHATPIDGAILMNTGQMLQIMSCERFPATFHRIRIPEKEIQKRTSRQSILYFLFPDDETPLVPLIKDTFKNTGNEEPITAFQHVSNISQKLFY